jgi:hypothetical protein
VPLVRYCIEEHERGKRRGLKAVFEFGLKKRLKEILKAKGLTQ